MRTKVIVSVGLEKVGSPTISNKQRAGTQITTRIMPAYYRAIELYRKLAAVRQADHGNPGALVKKEWMAYNAVQTLEQERIKGQTRCMSAPLKPSKRL